MRRLVRSVFQAVILSGGWDERLSLPRHRDNVHDVYHLLREHGFKRNNIHVFFANGGDPIKGESQNFGNVLRDLNH